MSTTSGPDPAVAAAEARKSPQKILDDFWANHATKAPGKVTNIFPPSLYANLLPPRHKRAAVHGINAAQSYEAAAQECRDRVDRIVKECKRTNQKFTDPDFDIEGDLGWGNNCLKGLVRGGSNPGTTGVSAGELKYALQTLATSNLLGGQMLTIDAATLASHLNGYQAPEDDEDEGPPPGSVHRIDWIFEDPKFVIDGYSSSDVRQGANGDCWFISAIATICPDQKVMDRICVTRNEQCGVYGFVFHRDGAWFPTIIDDNLYLRKEDFESQGDVTDPDGEKERKYKRNNQTGSEALHFASCADQNETWLPLLEKAYAKAHGDYQAIEGGHSGEGVEDLTGGVASVIQTNRILDKNLLWEELLEVNKKFLFAASSQSASDSGHMRQGLVLSHAYSIIKAVEEEDEEGNKFKLVFVRNPWGSVEWNGPWSDGSKEWTPYWLQKLNHRFGDDGEFWITFDDLLKKFRALDRTRLFDEEWTVVQKWTSVNVAWVTGYLTTKFSVEIKKGGPTVFVLSQLDDRYFVGLDGQYVFDLNFLLQEEGAEVEDHIVRARSSRFGQRSISAEVDLPPGIYEVLPKIVAVKRSYKSSVQDVVRSVADENPQKLRQIGMNYDVAQAIAEPTEEEIEAEKKEAEEKKKKAEEEAQKEKEKQEEEEKKKKAEAKKAKKAAAKKHKQKKKGQHGDKHHKGKNRHPTPESEEEDEDEEEEEKEESEGEEGQWEDVEESSSGDVPFIYQNLGSESGDSDEADASQKPNLDPWNAVCVMGLRVYSRDSEVSVKLVKPKADDEAALLDIDGVKAGATV